MDKSTLESIRHPIESSRFIITLVVLAIAALIFLFMTIASIGLILFYVGLIAFGVWVAKRIARATFMNNMVRVSEGNFPAIAAIIDEAKDVFGYEKEIEAYVYEKGEYNMLLMPLTGKKIILINSELLVSDNLDMEMRFLIGRFVGALASRHFRLMWVEIFLDAVENLYVLNPLLYSYERAVIYSGDRLGLHFAQGNLPTSAAVLLKTMVGRDAAERVSASHFLEQGVQTKTSFSAWLAQVFSRFPHTTYRMANLVIYANEAFRESTQDYFAEMSVEEATAFKNHAAVLKKT